MNRHNRRYDQIVIGGGASGVFAAIAAKEAAPEASVALLEKSATLLAKVRVSGGGRCNVTHACFDPRRLVEYYPRGGRELLGPFSRFQPRDTIAWFEKRGVKLKTEEDGRVFPVTNTSETIIDCLREQLHMQEVDIYLKQVIKEITKSPSGFIVQLQTGSEMHCQKLLLATGSSKEGYLWAEKLGHTIIKPIPSLFAFNIASFALKNLSGISVDPIEVRLLGTVFSQKGPLLFTHFGFSGPTILKLSSFGAPFLHERNYRAEISINWLPDHSAEGLFQIFKETKEKHPQKSIGATNPFLLPRKLWKILVEELNERRFVTVSESRFRLLAKKLHGDRYIIMGKTTNKEEFVTCGGVSLKEVDFKTMQSKICPGLFFSGEILDIDGVTGGFNFQNAWTTGFIAGSTATAERKGPN